MKKLNVLMSVQTFAIAALAFGAMSAHAECAGCDAVKDVASQVEKLHENDPKDPLIAKSTKVLLAMPRAKGDVLSSDQIHEAVLLLAQIEKYDSEEAVIENTLDRVLKPNLKAFQAEIKRLPTGDSKLVSACLTAVLNEEENGND